MKVRPFDKPENNFTVLHNVIFDDIMKQCTPGEWKVLCAILRKTRGWQKDSDYISYSQIRDMTGIASSATIKSAIHGLEKKNLIGLKPGNTHTPNNYTLNTDYEAITESVIAITETVIPPITETVNTKETVKENIKDNNNTASFLPIDDDTPIEDRIIEIFCDRVGLHNGNRPYEHSPSHRKWYSDWVKQVSQLIKMDVKQAELEEAIALLKYNQYKIKQPASLIDTINNIRLDEKRFDAGEKKKLHRYKLKKIDFGETHEYIVEDWWQEKDGVK